MEDIVKILNDIVSNVAKLFICIVEKIRNIASRIRTAFKNYNSPSKKCKSGYIYHTKNNLINDIMKNTSKDLKINLKKLSRRITQCRK